MSSCFLVMIGQVVLQLYVSAKAFLKHEAEEVFESGRMWKKMRNSQPHHFLQNNLDKDLIQGQLPCDRSDREASGIALPEIGLMKHHPVKSG